jgi:hypothetical protein
MSNERVATRAAHASRVLVSVFHRDELSWTPRKKEKFVAVGHRDQPARRARDPEKSRQLRDIVNFNQTDPGRVVAAADDGSVRTGCKVR